MIKKILITVLSFCLLFCLFGCKDNQRTNENVTDDATFADFSAVDFDGRIVDSSVFHGYKVTMVNVWASWCNPCIDEMPALAELDKEYRDAGFQVIGIAYDTVDKNFNKVQSAYAAALEIIANTGATYRHLIPSKSFKTFFDGIKTVPVTVFVNENGYRIGNIYKGAKSKEVWENAIEAMLESVE